MVSANIFLKKNFTIWQLEQQKKTKNDLKIKLFKPL